MTQVIASDVDSTDSDITDLATEVGTDLYTQAGLYSEQVSSYLEEAPHAIPSYLNDIRPVELFVPPGTDLQQSEYMENFVKFYNITMIPRMIRVYADKEIPLRVYKILMINEVNTRNVADFRLYNDIIFSTCMNRYTQSAFRYIIHPEGNYEFAF